MTRRILLVCYVLLGYFLFLLMTWPAIHVYEYFRANLPEIKPSSMQGSIWQFSADRLLIANQLFDFSQASLNLLPLFAGNISFTVKLKSRDIRANAKVTFADINQLKIEKLNSVITARQLMKFLPSNTVIAGNIQIKLQFLFFHRQHKLLGPSKGRIIWKNATIGNKQALHLGQVVIDLKSQNKIINGKISNSQSIYKIQGKLEIKNNGAYLLSARLAARDKNNTQAYSQIQQLGTIDNQGRYHFRLKGKI